MNKEVENIFTDRMTPEILKGLYDEHGASSYVIGIPKEYIVANDYAYVKSFIDSIESFEQGKENAFILSTSAYDDDSRELFEIKEWVDYLDMLIHKIPRLFYHVEAPSKMLILQCLCTKTATRTSHGTINHALDRVKMLDLLMFIKEHLTDEEEKKMVSDLDKIMK